MTAQLPQVSRADKAFIIKAVHTNLSAREQAGPPEPALDAYIPELADISSRLDQHVMGNVVADGTRALLLAKLDLADVDVAVLEQLVTLSWDVMNERYPE